MFSRKSSVYIDRIHALLFHQLKEKHSQIRLSALRICNCLFKYVSNIYLMFYLCFVVSFIYLKLIHEMM